MVPKIILEEDIARRSAWVAKIAAANGQFAVDAEVIEHELEAESQKFGLESLIGHFRLAGAIPEQYEHDSREEKLYSKYTDALLALAFKKIGLRAIVLQDRADAADVEAVVEDYSLVADAKAFRLSRTAKNQKDFKVEAMDRWKRGKDFALVVCPLYQLPSRASQIYHQASARNVCVFSYSHLNVLIKYSALATQRKSTHLLHEILKEVRALNPSKDASPYWQAINRCILNFDAILPKIWDHEKQALLESLIASKEEALQFLAQERGRIMGLSHEEAVSQLIEMNRIDGRTETIQTVGDNNLMALA